MKYAIGIDIGGTNTEIGLVDETGKILHRSRLSTESYCQADPYIQDIRIEIQRLMQLAGISQIESIGIGGPNGNHLTGSIEANTSNLNIKTRIPFREKLEEVFGVPVALDNDANAAALGELIYGGARGMRHFIMITLGTGIGSGIVVDGKLVHGHTGVAGELGHIIVQPNGRACSCGRNGCVETYASARGICKNYIEVAQEHNKPLSEEEKAALKCKHVGELTLQGDAIALEAYRRASYWLGIALANAVAFSSPEAIFLMGGPTRAGEALMKPLQKYFEENLLFLYKGKVQLRMSELSDSDVAILGAAALGKTLLS